MPATNAAHFTRQKPICPECKADLRQPDSFYQPYEYDNKVYFGGLPDDSRLPRWSTSQNLDTRPELTGRQRTQYPSRYRNFCTSCNADVTDQTKVRVF